MKTNFLWIVLLVWPIFSSTDEWDSIHALMETEARLSEQLQAFESQLLASQSEEERREIQHKWKSVRDELFAVKPKLYASVTAAYRSQPKADKAHSQIAFDTLAACMEEDRWETAADLAQLLVEKGHIHPQLHELAGIAAFRAQRFELAQKYLDIAKQRGPLMQITKDRVLAYLPDIIDDWQMEQHDRAEDKRRGDLPIVELETDEGTITLILFEYQAPNTVANFVHLIEKGFYDGAPFHRVLGNFMMQGGDPTGTGEGGPGWSIACECYRENYRHHFRGTLSMAHAGRDTGGSQFFITFIPTPHLDGKHTAFGRVIDGWEVLPRIVRRDPSKEEQLSIVPSKIIKATVKRKRDVPYIPEKLPPHEE